MSIVFKILRKKREKESVREGFFELFQNVYHRSLNDAEWRHLFLEAPYGESTLLVAVDEALGAQHPVGAANLIGQRLQAGKSHVEYFFYTTSAILPEYRDLKTYLDMVDLLKNITRDEHKCMILAFPNTTAFPLLTRLCGFRGLNQERIVKIACRGNWGTYLKPMASDGGVILDEPFLSWRFRHKDYFYDLVQDKVVIGKVYEGALDVLEVLEESFEKCLTGKLPRNTAAFSGAYILERRLRDPQGACAQKTQEIRPVCFPLHEDCPVRFMPSLLMSDVY